ncbi:MAG: hypothetical protein ACRD1Y_08535 [Terriglobales bacterium]
MDRRRIAKRVRAILSSPKNVRFDTVISLLDKHIAHEFPGEYTHNAPAGSHHAFTIRDQTFSIPRPHGGHVKEYYIKRLKGALEELGVFDWDTEPPKAETDAGNDPEGTDRELPGLTSGEKGNDSENN